MSNRIIVQTSPNQVNVYEGDLNIVGDTSTLINGEVPSGAVNGINAIFTLAHAPIGLVMITVNGLIQREGVSYDYTRSGGVVTFSSGSKPQTGDAVLVTYNYQA